MTIEYKDSKRITAVSSDWTSDVTSNITWSTTGKVGWNISGTTISRTGSTGWSTSKIQSTDTFTVGDGAFMIEFSGNMGATMLGFNKGTLGYYYGGASPQNSADFSIYMAGGDLVEVYESGSKNYGSGGTRSNASDRYRIEVSNSGVVKYYYQAGGTGSFVLKYTSSITASGTYFIQSNAYGNSATATVHSKTVTTTVAKPTNVQDNSILVEKNTARRYWFDADASYTTVEAGATADSNGGAAYVTYKQITGLTAGDEISHVTFDVYNTPTDTSFKGGVYTESSSNPTTLLASGELTNQNVSNTYTTLSIPLTSNATVPSNGIVWVAIIPNKTNPLLRVSTSSSSYTNSKFSTTTGSYTNYSNWMLSTASVQGAGENNVRFGVKIYHAPAWTMQPTFQDDFTTDNWDNMSSRINVNTTTEKLDFAMYRDGANDSAVYDLGAGNVSDTAWVLRWKMNFTAVYASGNGNRLWFGLSSLPQTTNQGTAQDSIMMYQNHDGTDCFSASYSNDSSLPQTNTKNPDYATGTTYYCELKRTSSTTIESRMWTGGYDGTLLSNAEDSVSNSTIGSVTGLRYVKMSNIYASQGGSVITGTIDDLEFYNGVTSIN